MAVDAQRFYQDPEGIWHKQFFNHAHGANGRFVSGSAGGVGTGSAATRKATGRTNVGDVASDFKSAVNHITFQHDKGTSPEEIAKQTGKSLGYVKGVIGAHVAKGDRPPKGEAPVPKAVAKVETPKPAAGPTIARGTKLKDHDVEVTYAAAPLGGKVGKRGGNWIGTAKDQHGNTFDFVSKEPISKGPHKLSGTVDSPAMGSLGIQMRGVKLTKPVTAEAPKAPEFHAGPAAKPTAGKVTVKDDPQVKGLTSAIEGVFGASNSRVGVLAKNQQQELVSKLEKGDRIKVTQMKNTAKASRNAWGREVQGIGGETPQATVMTYMGVTGKDKEGHDIHHFIGRGKNGAAQITSHHYIVPNSDSYAKDDYPGWTKVEPMKKK